MEKSAQKVSTSEVRSIRKRMQDTQISAVRQISRTLARWLPPFPRVPFADRLPPAERLVNRNFDRVHDLLEEQREFALGLVDAIRPVTKKFGARERGAELETRASSEEQKEAS